jgi:hypothetical protein
MTWSCMDAEETEETEETVQHIGGSFTSCPGRSLSQAPQHRYLRC